MSKLPLYCFRCLLWGSSSQSVQGEVLQLQHQSPVVIGITCCKLQPGIPSSGFLRFLRLFGLAGAVLARTYPVYSLCFLAGTSRVLHQDQAVHHAHAAPSMAPSCPSGVGAFCLSASKGKGVSRVLFSPTLTSLLQKVRMGKDAKTVTNCITFQEVASTSGVHTTWTKGQ